MTMQTEVNRCLELAAKQTLPAQLVANCDQDQVEISLIAIDSIGCAFDLLAYRTARLEKLDAKQLQRLGQQLARRVTYLLEPIRVIEIDGQESTLQLRSNQPQQYEGGKRYYEVLAQPGSIAICRYEKLPDMPRKREAANVTREVLNQLVADFSAASQV